ncbi:MAG: hypothetical protein JW883_16670 [Deltaproteobacteria bacterium]|nr:hypothetical protein [Deltaproteobacteria bacterium]
MPKKDLYLKGFGKSRPDKVKSIEEIVREKMEKKAKRRKRKQLEKQEAGATADGLKPGQASA